MSIGDVPKLIVVTGIVNTVATTIAQITLRRDTCSETADTIRIGDAIPSPLEHSHQTHIQTYGLMNKPNSRAYLLIRCAYTGGVCRRVARTSPLEAWPMRDGRRPPPLSGFGKVRIGGRRMYTLETRESTIRIPAEYIRRGRRLEDHIDELAHDAFECRFDEDEDFTVLTFDHEAVGRGKIIHGDGAIYQNVRFKALVFSMDNNEVIDGAVSEVSEYGAFVRIGPMEALLHKSQILDEPIQVNLGVKRIEGSQSGRYLEEGSFVRSRIVSKSINHNDPRSSKIGLNCKMDGLGSFEWVGGDE
ncbi:MAG TPA: DNA-directed RNA polymerase [Candidatus Poseidoniales archaeon]|nr:MAG: DNA-directed RNA polymerase [Euryarchaeota archaeon]HIG33267.1 DNA-directed RNA polymerase [Candidatus Poseidoniales archaeon]HIL67186.1 DNA-directed RNA polymerase [Candidatus Poseidoniales archaeon]